MRPHRSDLGPLTLKRSPLPTSSHVTGGGPREDKPGQTLWPGYPCGPGGQRHLGQRSRREVRSGGWGLEA